jgi:hypothetical protein
MDNFKRMFRANQGKTGWVMSVRDSVICSSACLSLILCLIPLTFEPALVSAQKSKPVLRAYLELKSFGDGKGTVLVHVINPLKFPITVSIDHKEQFNVPAKGSVDMHFSPGSSRTFYATGGGRDLDPPLGSNTKGGEVLELSFCDCD